MQIAPNQPNRKIWLEYQVVLISIKPSNHLIDRNRVISNQAMISSLSKPFSSQIKRGDQGKSVVYYN